MVSRIFDFYIGLYNRLERSAKEGGVEIFLFGLAMFLTLPISAYLTPVGISSLFVMVPIIIGVAPLAVIFVIRNYG